MYKDKLDGYAIAKAASQMIIINAAVFHGLSLSSIVTIERLAQNPVRYPKIGTSLRLVSRTMLYSGTNFNQFRLK